MFDLDEIQSKTSTIQHIHNEHISVVCDEYLDFIEYYLNQNTRILKDNIFNSITAKNSCKLKSNN